MLRCLILTSFIVCVIAISNSQAQSKQQNQSSDQLFKEDPFDRGATYSDPDGEENQSRKKKKKKRKNSYGIDYEQKKKEFDERMKRNRKKYKKMQKEMEKPQYSDPSYFGHKKKPKKRKPGKKKFCEECGIRH